MKKEIFCLFAFILFACSGKKDNSLVTFNSLNEGLVNSNNIITTENELIYYSFMSKLEDPASHDKAILWQPKIMVVRKISADMIAYIEIVKHDLKVAAGLKIQDGPEVFDEDNSTVVPELFETNGNAKKLYENLKNYKDTLLRIDSEISREFNNLIIITTRSFDSSHEKNKNFTQSFFNNISVEAALSTLIKFQNNIKINENRIIFFINSKITDDRIIWDLFLPLTTQSSSYVKEGQEIEITAGVGSFITRPGTVISIDEKTQKIEPSGVAIYKFKAAGKEGKHYTTVKIEYIDQWGKKDSVTKRLEYTVSVNKEKND